jgi:ribosome-binding protein aMBF1 (putative translation factor)
VTALRTARDLAIEAAFARSVGRLRKARGWDRGTLARESGVEPTVLCRVENGTRGCTVPTAWKLARALGTTVDAMIAEADLRAGGDP